MIVAAPITACGLPDGTGVAYDSWSDYPDHTLPPELRLVQAALLAANPHNTQPWRFVVTTTAIELWRDPDRSLGAMDPLGREQVIGLGCALENLAIAAPGFGRSTTITPWPDQAQPLLAARIELAPAPAHAHALADTIAQRHTQRGRYVDAPLSDTVEPSLRELIADLETVELVLLRSASARAAFRRGTIDATKAIVDDREMNEASHAWWRQSEAAIERHRDGLTIACMGFGAANEAFGKLGRGPSASKAGAYWIRNTEGNQTTGSAFGALVTASLQDPQLLLAVGRAWQRIHLWLATHGLAAQPLNQMFERRDRELQRGLPGAFGERLAALAGEHAQLGFRVGYAWDEFGPSPRRPVDWVVQS
ncbi:MAG: hypothetical protein U0168_13645 [Nannocystaceae bacterium]